MISVSVKTASKFYNKFMKQKTLHLLIGILTLVVLMGIVPQRTHAQMGDMMRDETFKSDRDATVNEQHQIIDTVLKNLLDKYQVSKTQDLDCKKITDDEFEQVGDAQMEVMHPGEAHEAMDQMMGGEGSDSLKSMHIRMGQNYLGCQNNSNYNHDMMGGIGMMGSSMTGNGFSNSYKPNRQFTGNHMGWMNNDYNNFSFAPILMMTGFWVLLIIGIILLVIFLRKQNASVATNDDSALEILKIRYAKGEINKKQFEDLKRDIS